MKVAQAREPVESNSYLLASVKHVLFVCSQNRLRSPTAEQVFASHPGIVCASAGTNHDADNALTSELVEWADIIFVMEKSHRDKLASTFKLNLSSQRVVCLDIPDEYEYMDPGLVRLLRAKVLRFLPIAHEQP
jgi:predicted protein tyrosine phosphatase